MIQNYKLINIYDKSQQFLRENMNQTDLQKENERLRRVNRILIIYVIVSIAIQLYNAWM